LQFCEHAYKLNRDIREMSSFPHMVTHLLSI
jgi:hypothetical protein